MALTNDVFAVEARHYVTVWMLADYGGGELVAAEPHRYDQLGWYSLDRLSAPLFAPWAQLLSSSSTEAVRAAFT